MACRFHFLCFLALCLAIAGCSNRSVDESEDGLPVELVLVKELVFENLLTPAGIDIDSEGNIYVADKKEKHIKVFSHEGELMYTIGRAGKGPGEFTTPATVSVHHERLAVGDQSGRVTLFDLQGTYVTSFVIPQIRHINSDLRIVNDSLMLVGGYVLGEEFLGGTLLHLYGFDGIERKSFGPLSKTAQRMQSVGLSGAKFDFDDAETIWSVQLTEYTIVKYERGGEWVNDLHVQPDYFRPLSKKEPEQGGSSVFLNWMAQWDRPFGIYSLNDSMLVVSVQIGQLPAEDTDMLTKTDFIRKRDGHVLRTLTTDERLMYVDREGQLYFQLPATKEPATRFRVYQVAGN